MKQPADKDPLHGIIVALVENFGWDELGQCVDIRCFQLNPSVQSSLKFLRKTPWARKKVEDLYLGMVSLRKHANHDSPDEPDA